MISSLSLERLGCDSLFYTNRINRSSIDPCCRSFAVPTEPDLRVVVKFMSGGGFVFNPSYSCRDVRSPFTH